MAPTDFPKARNTFPQCDATQHDTMRCYAMCTGVYWKICCAAQSRWTTNLFPKNWAEEHASTESVIILSLFFEVRPISTDIWPLRSPNLTSLDYFFLIVISERWIFSQPTKKSYRLESQNLKKYDSSIYKCNSFPKYDSVNRWECDYLRGHF